MELNPNHVCLEKGAHCHSQGLEDLDVLRKSLTGPSDQRMPKNNQQKPTYNSKCQLTSKQISD